MLNNCSNPNITNITPQENGTTTVTTAKTGLVNLSSLIPAVPTVDQTYDGTSTNAQSGTAVAEAVSNCIQYAMVITDYTA